MAEHNKALNNSVPVEFKGKTYNLVGWSYQIQADYETYLESQAYAALRRSKAYLTADEYEEQRSQLNRDLATGIYSFGSAVVSKSLQSLANLKQLFYLAFKDNSPDITLDIIGEMLKDEEKATELLNKLAQINNDPNVQVPTQQ